MLLLDLTSKLGQKHKNPGAFSKHSTLVGGFNLSFPFLSLRTEVSPSRLAAKLSACKVSAHFLARCLLGNLYTVHCLQKAVKIGLGLKEDSFYQRSIQARRISFCLRCRPGPLPVFADELNPLSRIGQRIFPAAQRLFAENQAQPIGLCQLPNTGSIFKVLGGSRE